MAEIGLDATNFDVTVMCKDGKSMDVTIDVPMRSIDAGIPPPEPHYVENVKVEGLGLMKLGYYPRLLRLLKELDVPVRPDDLTFAFSNDTSTKIPYLIYNGLSGLQGLSIPSSSKSPISTLLAIIYYTISFIYLCIICLLHYHLHLFPRIKEITFGEFCTAFMIPGEFMRNVLVPLYSGVCTCAADDILNYPAGLIVGTSRNPRYNRKPFEKKYKS